MRNLEGGFFMGDFTSYPVDSNMLTLVIVSNYALVYPIVKLLHHR